MVKAVKTIGMLINGEDVPGMNTVIRAMVRMAINRGPKVKEIMRGHAGPLEEEIADMEPTSVSDTINRGGTILHTAGCRELTTPGGQQKDVEICRKRGVDDMAVIGGDGSFRDAGRFSSLGINTIGLPGTIDLDIACTDYTIGFDTAVNTTTGAIDKIRDTPTSHERCSVAGIIGKNAGYIVLWYSIANGAEDILLPKRYGGDRQALINRITDNRRRGKRRNIIINAERTGHPGPMAKYTEVVTGIETRITILGHMQRGDTPICKDRVCASIIGAKAVELLARGKSDRLVACKCGESAGYDIQETLNMSKDIPEGRYEITKMLIR